MRILRNASYTCYKRLVKQTEAYRRITAQWKSSLILSVFAKPSSQTEKLQKTVSGALSWIGQESVQFLGQFLGIDLDKPQN